MNSLKDKFSSLFGRKNKKQKDKKDKKDTDIVAVPDIKLTRDIHIVTGKEEKLKPKIKHLIVDDSDVNRIVLKKYLDRINETYIETSSSLESIRLMDDYDFFFVWMDVRMPNMNGVDATSAIRKKGYANYIIGITGQVDVDTQKECRDAGMNLILAKPVIPQTIYDIINKYSGTNH